jgi:multidrug transporter EmrE-like cation transporter
MKTPLYIGLNGIIIAFILAINDVFSFGMTKNILQTNKELYWLAIPMILYAIQILIFYYGLKSTSMTILNKMWNLISNILITILGIYFFKEKINNIKTIALLLGFISIILFAVDELNEG